jgi:hypothetical protein
MVSVSPARQTVYTPWLPGHMAFPLRRVRTPIGLSPPLFQTHCIQVPDGPMGNRHSLPLTNAVADPGSATPGPAGRAWLAALELRGLLLCALHNRWCVAKARVSVRLHPGEHSSCRMCGAVSTSAPRELYANDTPWRSLPFSPRRCCMGRQSAPPARRWPQHLALAADAGKQRHARMSVGAPLRTAAGWCLLSPGVIIVPGTKLGESRVTAAAQCVLLPGARRWEMDDTLREDML